MEGSFGGKGGSILFCSYITDGNADVADDDLGMNGPYGKFFF